MLNNEVQIFEFLLINNEGDLLRLKKYPTFQIDFRSRELHILINC